MEKPKTETDGKLLKVNDGPLVNSIYYSMLWAYTQSL